jgi:hypothetical protein
MLIFCDLRVFGCLTSCHTELSLSFVAFFGTYARLSQLFAATGCRGRCEPFSLLRQGPGRCQQRRVWYGTGRVVVGAVLGTGSGR